MGRKEDLKKEIKCEQLRITLFTLKAIRLTIESIVKELELEFLVDDVNEIGQM